MNQKKIAPAIRLAEAACSFMCTTEEHAKAVAALADEAIRLYSNIVEMEDLNISSLAKIESLSKELTAEAARTAEEKLRADQMTKQHRIQCDISKSAVATLVGLGYTDRGGEQWAPPIGKAPDFNLLDAAHARIADLEAQVQAMGRVPITDAQIEKATGAKRGEPLFLVAKGFTVAIEAAHGITHPTGD